MINWSTIDTVLLDMDGTLLDLHYDNHFWLTHLPKRYADLHNLRLEDAEIELSQHIEDLRGTLEWYCLDYWSELLQLDVPSIKKETQDKIQQRPYATDFLTFLQAQGKQIYLVTNAHPAGLQIKLEKTAIGQYFDEIITSHQFKAAKETQNFWQQLQQHLKFNKERSLFIDDNLQVLETAVDFGIKHILGIHQPDSQQTRQLNDTAIPAIHHFNEIIQHG